jgi:hypothetical protein
MFTTQQTHNFGRTTDERSVVDCEKCHTPIYVNKPGSVSVEFSVPCPHCGHRGIYFKRMLMSDAAGEGRRSPRDQASRPIARR